VARIAADLVEQDVSLLRIERRGQGGVPRGALVARMKRAKACTSAPSSSGSITVSKAATEVPLEVFSVGWSGLVMPISLR
jgi:hypothetical protein